MTTESRVEHRAIADADLPSVFQQGYDFFLDRGLPGTYLPEKAQLIWSVLRACHPSIVLGAFTDGQLIGGMGVSAMSDEWSDTQYAAEIFFFIQKAHRNKAISDALIADAEHWARMQGMPELRLALFRVEDAKLLDRYYRMKSYRPFQTIYRKVL